MILALIILFVFFAIIYVSSIFHSSSKLPNQDELKFMASQCLKRTTEDAIYLLGKNGGQIDIKNLATQDPFKILYNRYLPSKKTISKDIENYINNNIVKCMLNHTRSKKITYDDPHSKVIFTRSNIVALVESFISIKTNDTITNLGTISSTPIEIRFNTVYSAIDDLNKKKIDMDKLSKEHLNITVSKTENEYIYAITDLSSSFRYGKFVFFTATD